MEKMKRQYLTTKGLRTLPVAVMVLLTASCGYKAVHDKTDGLVERLVYDSVMTVHIDGSSIDFDISVAKYTHGRVMEGDSVVVYYYGDLSKGRALAESIYLKDRPGNVLEVKRGEKPANANAPQTREGDPEQIAREKAFSRATKHLKH